MIIRKNISDQIFDYLLDEIKDGNLKPGDRLQNERDLAEYLGVSRVPLREAIRSLSKMGILTTKHGEGTFVNSYNPEVLGRAMNVYMLLDETLALELIEVRKIMESEAARLASQNATEEDIEKIRKLIECREESIKNMQCDKAAGQMLYELDREFHKAVAEATHNSVFVNFLDAIGITLKIHQQEASQRPSMPEIANKYHRKVLEAIIEKNPKKASKMMYEHLEDIEKAIMDQVEQKK